MGLFDKLFGKKKTGTAQDNSYKPYRPDAREQREPPPYVESSQSKQLRLKLRPILSEVYPNYIIREYVDVRDIDKRQSFGGPADFALYLEDEVVGAIMLIEPAGKRTKRVYGVELACTNTGAAYANFLVNFNNAHFPFSREHAIRYLKSRIK